MIRLPPLREYQSASIDLSEAVANRIATAAPEALAVAPTGEPGRWNVTANSWVGTIVTPDIEALIRPKIGVENLLLLLDAGMPEASWRPEVFGYSTRQEVLPAFASFFARTVDQLTARGLIRSYRPEHDRLTALRGRVDFATQLRQPAVPSPIACSFDDYTADVIENRCLLGAIDRLLRLAGIDPRTRMVLQHARARFDGVRAVLPTATQIEAIHYSRLNEHYRPAVRLARLIIDNLTIGDERGGSTASSFLLDMNVVFEQFVTRRLRHHLRGRLAVLDQVTTHLGEHDRIPIRPDLLFHRRDRTAYVGDVKYKLASKGLGRTSDYYQLLAYCTSLGLDEGVLIYAQTDGQPPENTVVVRHASTRLIAYRLDLSGDRSKIEASVQRLATWLDQQATGGAPLF